MKPADERTAKAREQRIREIAEREKKATKGPWERKGPKNGWGDNIAVCPIGDKEPAIYHDFAHPESVIFNADFVAHARMDIPFLLEALASERSSAIKEAREECARIAEKLADEYRQASKETGDYQFAKSVAANSVAAAIRALSER
jgi:hypothetical protein